MHTQFKLISLKGRGHVGKISIFWMIILKFTL